MLAKVWLHNDQTKVKDLGVIFDQFLNFDDHITAICRTLEAHIFILET